MSEHSPEVVTKGDTPRRKGPCAQHAHPPHPPPPPTADQRPALAAAAPRCRRTPTPPTRRACRHAARAAAAVFSTPRRRRRRRQRRLHARRGRSAVAPPAWRGGYLPLRGGRPVSTSDGRKRGGRGGGRGAGSAWRGLQVLSPAPGPTSPASGQRAPAIWNGTTITTSLPLQTARSTIRKLPASREVASRKASARGGRRIQTASTEVVGWRRLRDDAVLNHKTNSWLPPRCAGAKFGSSRSAGDLLRV